MISLIENCLKIGKTYEDINLPEYNIEWNYTPITSLTWYGRLLTEDVVILRLMGARVDRRILADE